MQNIFKVSWIYFAGLLLSMQLYAATYYVDNTLSSNITDGSYSINTRSGGGSDGNAYVNIQDGINALSHGDTLYLREGTYNETGIYLGANFWNNPGVWTTISSYPGEWAIVDGQHNMANDRYPGGGNSPQEDYTIFRGTSQRARISFVRFERMEITGGGADLNSADYPSSGAGIFLYGSDFEFRNLYIHNNYGSDDNNYAGLDLYCGRTLIEYCRFKANGQIKPDQTGGGYRTDSMANLMIFADYKYQNELTSLNDPVTGVATSMFSNEVRYNLFEADSGLTGPANGQPADVSYYTLCGFKHKGMQRLTGYVAEDRGWAGDAVPNDDRYEALGDKIHHNVFIDHAVSIKIDQDYAQAYNNIIINKKWPDTAAHPAIRLRDGGCQRRGPYKPCVYNNTIFADGQTSIYHQPLYDGYPTGNISFLSASWPSAELDPLPPNIKTFLFNNLIVSSGGRDLDVETNIEPEYDLSSVTIDLRRNYFYNPVDDGDVVHINNENYAKAQLDSGPCADVVYQGSTAVNGALFKGITGGEQYKTLGDHNVVAGGDVLATAGVGGNHPYLNGVTLPEYIGATDPYDDSWVDGVLELRNLGVPVQENIYYVSPSSTSTDWAAAQSIDSPCNAQTAFDNAQAGDTVQFRGGVYKIPANTTGDWLSGYYSPNHSGTEDARIVFMAYPGEMPVFDGTAGGVDKDGHGYGHFARIMSNTRYVSGSKTYHEYITFDGFTFQCDGGLNEGKITLTGGDSYSANPRVRGLIVQNCIFNGGTWDNEARALIDGVWTGTGDNHEGIFVSQTTGLIIRNCKIFDYASANHNMNTSAIKTYHSDNMTIENCEIYDSTYGIYSKSNTDSLTVRYCYIHDNRVGFFAGTTGWWNDSNDHSKGYFVIENTDNVLCHNVFSNNVRGTISGFTQGGGDLDGFSVYNNTIYGGTGYTASVGLGSGERQQYYNNIQYGPKIDNDIGLLKWYCGNNDPDAIAEGMAEFNFGLDVCDHNQFSDLASNFLIRIKKPNESTVSYSTLQIWQTSGVLTDESNPGEGSLTSNPLFVNASGTMSEIADFALQENSPCKGAGREGVDMGADISRVGVQSNLPSDTDAPSVPVDFIVTRVSGARVDLSWSPSTDNVGVSGYRVYRNGSEIDTTMSLTYTDTTASSATSYSYTVVAFDAAGNASIESTSVNVITGHEYFVAPNGDDSNTGSIDTPWATPLKAWTMANAGDVVNFRAGTYEVASQIWTKYFGHDGTAVRPIVFRSNPGEAALIRTSLGCAFIIERDYNYIEDLQFYGGATWFFVAYDTPVQGFVARRCVAKMTAGGDNTGFVNVHGAASDTLIENCQIIGPGSSGFHLNTAGIICFRPERLKILNNEISNTMVGIYYKHANSQDNLNPDIEIAYNYIHDTGRHAMMLNCNHAYFHDNLIGLNNAGILVNESNGGPGGDGNLFVHNTFAGEVGFTLYYDTNATDTTPGAIGNILRDNIFTTRVSMHRYSSVAHQTQSDYNLFVTGNAIIENRIDYTLASWQTHAGTDGNSIVGSPVFVGGVTPSTISDFALATGSPGKGTASDGKDMGADVNQVGVQSDLPVDIEAPSVPTNLVGTAVSQTQIDLTWTPSTDNVGVTGYNIYCDGILIDTCVDTSYSNVDLAPGTIYSYAVSAFDAAGNESVLSSSISVSTLSDENNILYLNPTGDTFINLNTDNNSSSQNLNLYTWPVNQVANSILIKWGMGSVPSNIIITEAKLRLYMTGTESNGGDELYDVSVHRIINYDPNITMATGYSFDGTNEWTANSACYDNIPMAQADIAAEESTIQIDKNPGYKEWDVLGMVNYWIAHPNENYGMLINSDTSASEDSNRIFASLEHPDSNFHPVIVIKYQQSGNNNIPVITPVPSITKYEGELIEINIDVTDSDNSDTITVSADSMPAGASLIKIADRIWQFTWQTDFASAGIYTVTLIANDGKADSSPLSVTIVVNDVLSGVQLTDKPMWFKE